MVAGQSLQLIDLEQDNSRSSNWATDPEALATPGAVNSVATSDAPKPSPRLHRTPTASRHHSPTAAPSARGTSSVPTGCTAPSVTRRASAFQGGSYEHSFVLADVRLTGDAPTDEVRLFWAAEGLTVVAPLPDGSFRVVAPVDGAPEDPSHSFIQSLLDTRGPGRLVVTDVVWGSRFRIHHRVADTYRAGRILLAGDAAHVHSPAGGQGMNLGIQDAIALADALVDALAGEHTRLDAYDASRRPVAHQVVELTDRLTRLATLPRPLRPVRNMMLGIAGRIPAARRGLAARLSGLVYR